MISKSTNLGIRVTPKEKELISQAAAEMDSSISEICLQGANLLAGAFYGRFGEGLKPLLARDDLTESDREKVEAKIRDCEKKAGYFKSQVKAVESRADIYRDIENINEIVKVPAQAGA